MSECRHRDRCDRANVGGRRGHFFNGPHEVSSFEQYVEWCCVEDCHVTELLVIDRDQGRSSHHESGARVVEGGYIDRVWVPHSLEFGRDDSS